MEFDQRDFFVDEDPEVGGFCIGEVNDTSGRYRIIERWDRPEEDGGPTWITYWVSEDAMQARIESGQISHRQRVSEKQFEGFKSLAGL